MRVCAYIFPRSTAPPRLLVPFVTGRSKLINLELRLRAPLSPPHVSLHVTVLSAVYANPSCESAPSMCCINNRGTYVRADLKLNRRSFGRAY